MDELKRPIIFSPDNEPYLGREFLYHFDQIISSCLEENALIAPRTHLIDLSDAQRMACAVIPQAISIALSIRELVRQGYLFGAYVLVRPLAERAAILLYLKARPEEIQKWNSGWRAHEDKAPSLAHMFKVIQEGGNQSDVIEGCRLTDSMNSLLHGRPDSGFANLISMADGRTGYAVSKILDRPDLCDEIGASVLPWLVVVLVMMPFYFDGESKA